jgi:sec-independent protein translocase protein TatB
LYLLIFEFLGTNELLVILVVALILLGPRRLPQMSKKLGKSLGEFKRASEDFKRTWEREIEMESAQDDARLQQAMLPAENSILGPTVGRGATATDDGAVMSPAQAVTPASEESVPAPSVNPVDPSVMQPAQAIPSDTPPTLNATTRKRNWL